MPEGTPPMPRGLARAWTRAVVDLNIEMVGQPSWEPLPTHARSNCAGASRPRPGRRPCTPTRRVRHAEKAADLLDYVTARSRAPTELRHDGEHDSTAELQARVAVRQAVRDAWAEGIEHAVQLSVLPDAGLAR